MGRRRLYESNAERQRAYRQRKAQQAAALRFARPKPFALRKKEPLTRSGGSVPAEGALCGHCEVAGLLLRVDRRLDDGRVVAIVLDPGPTRLRAGGAYPFRADLLEMVQ